MQLLQSRKMWVGLLLCLLLLIGFFYMRGRSSAQFPKARYIPPEGAAENEVGDKIPGNPAKTIEDMKRLYEVINIYRSRHGGQIGDLPGDYINNPQVYGFKDVLEAAHAFYNPDVRYSDAAYEREAQARGTTVVPYATYNTRPDGTPLGAPKPPGTRDLLASCRLYFHMNARDFDGDRQTIKPIGFYLLLWDDGAIEKMPWHKMLYVPKGGGEFGFAFPGQPNIPANAMNYVDYYRKVVRREPPPIGTTGG